MYKVYSPVAYSPDLRQFVTFINCLELKKFTNNPDPVAQVLHRWSLFLQRKEKNISLTWNYIYYNLNEFGVSFFLTICSLYHHHDVTQQQVSYIRLK